MFKIPEISPAFYKAVAEAEFEAHVRKTDQLPAAYGQSFEDFYGVEPIVEVEEVKPAKKRKESIPVVRQTERQIMAEAPSLSDEYIRSWGGDIVYSAREREEEFGTELIELDNDKIEEPEPFNLGEPIRSTVEGILFITDKPYKLSNNLEDPLPEQFEAVGFVIRTDNIDNENTRSFKFAHFKIKEIEKFKRYNLVYLWINQYNAKCSLEIPKAELIDATADTLFFTN